jgi:RNA polymerase sigma factor (sigma-70 family)
MTNAADNRAFVAEIARQHETRLRRFLASRLRAAPAADVPDLVQEVYLRLLRISRHETIRNPLAYVFTVAFHVLHQHRLSLSESPESADPVALLAEIESTDSDPAIQVESRERIDLIDRALRGLPRNVHAAFVLHRRFGFTVDEIAGQLGVSRGMVKKYLARAMAHCQQQDVANEAAL